MRPAYDVAAVRAAENAAMARLPDGELMQRAAAGLAAACGRLLRERIGRISGSRVAVLAGSGDNAGDALFAAARLARRGASVTVVALSSQIHGGATAAVRRAGGRLIYAPDAAELAGTILAEADAVLDGIVGIGGKGALRPAAAQLLRQAQAGGAVIIAVDLPSGVDANTGAVADPDAVVTADLTVTFGCIKQGLLVMPGAARTGELRLVDIGLGPQLPPAQVCLVDGHDARAVFARPGRDDNKYTRGVVGVVAGSRAYPGAAVLCTGAARLAGTGMVRYAGTAAGDVVAHWPDVVPHPEGPRTAGRAQAWVFGPGAGTDSRSRDDLCALLEGDEPVVVDADGLTLLATDAALAGLVHERGMSGRCTVLTPHEGEFARLGFSPGTGAKADRITAVRAAAGQLGATVLLKGSTTVIAPPAGATWINTTAAAELATAGSGDVLSGILGSLVAHARAGSPVTPNDCARLAAIAAFVHGKAGLRAAAGAEPVTALDVLGAVPAAIAGIRETLSGWDKDL